MSGLDKGTQQYRAKIGNKSPVPVRANHQIAAARKVVKHLRPKNDWLLQLVEDGEYWRFDADGEVVTS